MILPETKVIRITQRSRENPQAEFKWLMPFYNEVELAICFQKLDRKKAVGVDGKTKDEYAKKLSENIDHLIERMKKMSYRPQPVKEVLIEKEGQKGKYRPLGISTIEDKMVQRLTGDILNAIYDPIFKPCSYGFRPGLSCHTAIKALREYLFKSNCKVIIDVDLKNFFGTIDHKQLIEFLRIKIKDERFIRYIIRMLKAEEINELGELQSIYEK